LKRDVSVALLLISVFAAAAQSCSSDELIEIENLTLATVPTELNALVYVAEDLGFFTDNGIEIIFKDYDSGASAAAAMLNGEADIALAAEFPVARQTLNKRDIINIGTVAKYENTYILWRVDSGIESIRDLQGKKIGVTLTTISEFYLGRTLELNGLKIKDVILVDTKAADGEEALISGEVDAVVTWEPWVNQINQRLGDEVTIKAAQSAQYAYWNLVATPEWTNNHADLIKRLIKSLAQAEVYAAGHQAEAKATVKKWMNFDDVYLETIWPRYQFFLSLDQSLVIAMEDEARWMMSNGLTMETSMPRFIDHIQEEILREIKPEAVSIIR
jgi:NitT/TauT family transport system substrate-binding protein